MAVTTASSRTALASIKGGGSIDAVVFARRAVRQVRRWLATRRHVLCAASYSQRRRDFMIIRDEAILHLDDLSDRALQTLAEPVLKLDAEGRVVEASTAAIDLFGSDRAEVVGRDFFREVAPSALRPGFYGRFRDGVRQGRFQDRFSFVINGARDVVRATVRLSSEGPGRPCWVVLEDLTPVETLRGLEAIQAVARRSRAEVLDASACEKEPIHIPGAVQPHAALLVVDPASLRVVSCSDNLTDVLGLVPSETLGRSVLDLLPETLIGQLQEFSPETDRDTDVPRRVEAVVGPLETPFIVLMQRRGGRLLIEMEPAPRRGEDFGAPAVASVASALSRVGQAEGPDGAIQTAAQVVRELTGFERVLVYRFDRDWNGVAIAEDRDPNAYDSLLGLHFPASDIPAQARALYTRAPARFVYDRDYSPSPLVADSSLCNTPVDLSLVQARSLSPIHLEYQKNLGVNGSMSSSIMVEGRLWGLVIGHHRRPHYLAPDTRVAVASITETLGLCIEKLELAEGWRLQELHLAAETRLLERMAGAESAVEALLSGDPSILDFFDAAGAAYVEDQGVHLLGRTPTREQVVELTAWLAPRGSVYVSEELSNDFPSAEAYRQVGSGLLAAFPGGARRATLLWFRPEEVSTVAWGGDPHKAVEASGASLLPRLSFERWVEERRGASRPWLPWQIAAAERIAGAVERVTSRHNRRVAALNLKQAELVAALALKERLLSDKDLLTREIDHRVKNSLQIVASFVQMQSRATKDPSARAGLEETYGRVMSVARIHDSLWRSDDIGEVDIGQTISALCRDLSGMAGERRTLTVTAAPDIKLPYQQALSLSLIAIELITNALKYAYPPDEAGVVAVEVRADPERRVCLSVTDQGRGLPADWREAPRESGLGMKLINAMLSQIKGELRVETGVGSRFVVCA